MAHRALLMRIKERKSRGGENAAMKAGSPDVVPQGPLAAREIVLDVRGMEPPEPLERVLESIDAFGAGDKLTLVIDCRPLPLYRILSRNGFAFREKPGTESLYEIEIWRED